VNRLYLESKLEKRAYRVDEVADMLSASQKTVYEWIRTGVIPAHKIKNHFVVLADDFERLVKSLPSVPVADASTATTTLGAQS